MYLGDDERLIIVISFDEWCVYIRRILSLVIWRQNNAISVERDHCVRLIFCAILIVGTNCNIIQSWVKQRKKCVSSLKKVVGTAFYLNDTISREIIFLLHTAKKIRDRYIVYSINPKLDNQLFVDLHVLYKLRMWNCFCFDMQNWQNNHVGTYITCTKNVNKQRLGLIEEIMDLS